MNISDIKLPSKGILDQIEAILSSGQITGGPFFGFDQDSQVLLVLLIANGKLQHWHTQHCKDSAEHRELARLYVEAWADRRTILRSQLPPEVIEELDASMTTWLH